MEIKLPKYVELLINMLNENGYAAYAVGGAIRDSILGIEPKDWDIATSALPAETKKLFEDNSFHKSDMNIYFKVIPTGEKYGTMTIEVIEKYRLNKCEHLAGIYEITTFRYDSNYSDGRRPDNVTFGKSIIDDLDRRDFTMNAIAYNPLVGIIDPHNGVEDITNKIVKAVGDPQVRIKEDALRILRGIRFACKYNFELENATGNVIAGTGSLLKNVSKERITDEIKKILTYSKGNSETLNSTIQTLAEIFEIPQNKVSKWDDNQVIRDIDNDNPPMLKLYSILNKYKSMVDAEIWMRIYKYSNQQIKEVISYYKMSKFMEDVQQQDIVLTIKQLFNKFEHAYVCKYLDIYTKITGIDLSEITSQPYRLQDLAIDGHFLQSTFDVSGEKIGEILNFLLGKVMENSQLNTIETLSEMTRRYLNGEN